MFTIRLQPAGHLQNAGLHRPDSYKEETEVKNNSQDYFRLLWEFDINVHCVSLVSLYRAAEVSDIATVPSPYGITQL
jgi:hypothetical protein